MRSFKRALLALFIICLFAVVIFFVLENQQPVALVLFGWAAKDLPVAVPVLGALVVGLMIGPVLATILRGTGRRAPRSASPTQPPIVRQL